MENGTQTNKNKDWLCKYVLLSRLCFELQGARGFPGTPGLPGMKGHRVSVDLLLSLT